jgi:hypothetical protein
MRKRSNIILGTDWYDKKIKKDILFSFLMGVGKSDYFGEQCKARAWENKGAVGSFVRVNDAKPELASGEPLGAVGGIICLSEGEWRALGSHRQNHLK